MPLSKDDKKQFEKDLNNSERFILEKISSDRKSHALQFQNLNEKLEKLISMQRVSSSNIEADNLRQDKALTDYKKKMRPLERLTDNKNTGLITVTIIMAVAFWEKVVILFEIFRKKYGV